MIAEDVLVTDSTDPEPKPEAAKQQKNEVGSFLDELTQSQSRKKLDLISEIELYVELLETNFGQRLNSFLQTDCAVAFEEMSLFESADHLAQLFAPHNLFLSVIDETPVGCIVLENAASRTLLSVALTGKVPDTRLDGDFSASEKKVFLVFASLLNTALNESFEKVTELGVPEKATFLNLESVAEITKDEDWVCLSFSIAFLDNSEKMMLVLPLSLLSGEFPGGPQNQDGSEIVIDGKWQSALFDHIEKLKVPLLVELGSIELPLAQIDELTPGQELEIPVDQSKLKIFTEDNQAILHGRLETRGEVLEVKVTEKVK